MAIKTRPFDSARYLETERDQAEFLAAALETGEPETIVHCIGVVARARGMTMIAEAAGLSRKGLYKAVGEFGDPKLSTLVAILSALGVQITAKVDVAAPMRKKTAKTPRKRKTVKSAVRKAA